VPTLVTFVAVVTVLVVMDMVAGAVDVARLLEHTLVVPTLVLVMVRDLLPKPVEAALRTFIPAGGSGHQHQRRRPTPNLRLTAQ
jgi:hypothetical protein